MVASVIDEEVQRFDALARKWWDPKGPMASLHGMNPIRIAWVRDRAAAHFGRTPSTGEGPLEGLTWLDVGCGAGLLAEPLSRLGARVTGIDPAPTSIAVARAHAEETGAELTYREGTVEDLAAEGASFDVVTALEVVEHVNDPAAFVGVAGRLVRPGGMLALSTVNRTLKSFALAIVGAEYILRWLEPGTHRWDQFVKPSELTDALKAAGFEDIRPEGMAYNPIARKWSLTANLDVNYFVSAAKPASR